MTLDEALTYVRAASRALELTLDDAQACSVAEHLVRTAAMADILDAAQLPLEAELPEAFCPAPFLELPR